MKTEEPTKNTQTITTNQNNPSPTPKRFHAHQYMLCIIQELGYRRIFSPDFEFHFTVPTGDDPHRWTAMTLQQAEREIELRLSRLTLEGKDHPTPTKWRRQILAPSEKRVSIQVAAELLGISESTVRRLASEGMLPFSQTRKGHRRFSVDALEEFRRMEK